MVPPGKVRLSLDLSQISPNGLASPASIMSLEPPSPTPSGSWSINKSNAELTALLKDAYNAIKEKERDLMLAAEIGKSLLENNNALKSKCETLIKDYRKLRRKESKDGQTVSQSSDKTNVTRMAAPNSTGLTEELEESDSDATIGHSTSTELDIETLAARGRSRQMKHRWAETIRELESANAELQFEHDRVKSDIAEADRANRAKQRKLEIEIQRMHEADKLAVQKIEDLEKENTRLKEKQQAEFWNLRHQGNMNDKIEQLLHKVHALEEQNIIIERAKTEIERRLQRTAQEIERLHEMHGNLEDASKEFTNLQDVVKNRNEHIQELTMSLEEQRLINLGMRSGTRSRSNSVTDGRMVRRPSDPDGMCAPASPRIQRRTLLGEMESEFYRELSMFQRGNKPAINDDETPPFSPVISETDLHEFLLRNGVHPDEDNVSAIDSWSDEFVFLEEFDEDEATAKRKREWFWRRWARAVYRMLLVAWRWCRFLVLLCVAVLWALWSGPDDVLPAIHI